MLSRDPVVLRALGSLPTSSLAVLDTLLSELPFFQEPDPLAWRGVANIQFRVEALLPTVWRCSLWSTGLPPDLHSTPRARRFCFEFELHAPEVFGPLLALPGAHFRARGVTLVPGTMPRVARLELDTPVWPLSQPPLEEPLAVSHLFAGAFHGWGQALDSLRGIVGLDLAHEILVDHAPLVVAAQVATLDVHSVLPSQLNSWTPTPAQLAILADVSDIGLLHAVPWTGSHVATASPPCPPWSRAGEQDGLADSHGLTFIAALAWARAVAPLALLLECVDGLPSHPHYPVVAAAIQWAGYRIHYSMVHDHAQFGPCARRRWLAVLLRYDLEVPVHPGPLQFRDPAPVDWTHPSFEVLEAPEINHARLLDETTLHYYTNPAFYPRSSTDPATSPEEVLQRRLPEANRPLRTLCARYSQQHLLAAATLSERGLYAQLQIFQDRPAFLSPAQWALWLGATRPLVLVPPLEELFHGLGNSISVPQAAIPWAILLQAADLLHEPVEPLVLQVWHQRLQGPSLIAAIVRGWYYLGPLGPMVDFAFHPQVPQRANIEGPPTYPPMVYPYRMGVARAALFSPGGYRVEVTYPVGAAVSLLLRSARLPPVALPRLAVSSFARVWMPRDPASDLSGHILAVVPAQEPEDLRPQPPPVLLEPPEVTLHFHDPMRREHSRSVPQLATLHQVIWSLPLPDRLLQHVRPYVQGRPVPDSALAGAWADAHISLRVFPLPGGGIGSQEAALPPLSDDEEMLPEDPLVRHDPWAAPPGLTTRAAGSGDSRSHAKWDHLLLPSEHAFVLADADEAPTLVPRGQLGPLVAGLAFCPVSAVAEYFDLSPPGPTALVVPGQSRAVLPQPPDPIQVEGPLQILVFDPVAQSSYKRQVLLVHLFPGILYRPSVDDAIVIETADFVELVVESFEGLNPDFPALLAKPLSELSAVFELAQPSHPGPGCVCPPGPSAVSSRAWPSAAVHR